MKVSRRKFMSVFNEIARYTVPYCVGALYGQTVQGPYEMALVGIYFAAWTISLILEHRLRNAQEAFTNLRVAKLEQALRDIFAEADAYANYNVGAGPAAHAMTRIYARCLEEDVRLKSTS